MGTGEPGQSRAGRCHPGQSLPAALLTCAHRPGLSVALGSKGCRGGGVAGGGRDSLVGGPLEPPQPPAGTLSATCSPGASQRPWHTEWVLEGPQMSPPSCPKSPQWPHPQAPLPPWGSNQTQTAEDLEEPPPQPAELASEEWGPRDGSLALCCSVQDLLMGK